MGGLVAPEAAGFQAGRRLQRNGGKLLGTLRGGGDYGAQSVGVSAGAATAQSRGQTRRRPDSGAQLEALGPGPISERPAGPPGNNSGAEPSRGPAQRKRQPAGSRAGRQQYLVKVKAGCPLGSKRRQFWSSHVFHFFSKPDGSPPPPHPLAFPQVGKVSRQCLGPEPLPGTGTAPSTERAVGGKEIGETAEVGSRRDGAAALNVGE